MKEDMVNNEDNLHHLQKVDSMATINALRMKQKNIFRLPILLCCLVAIPMVRPTFLCDVQLLEHKFACGYGDEAIVFYVYTINEARETSEITVEKMDAWDPLWKQKNNVVGGKSRF